MPPSSNPSLEFEVFEAKALSTTKRDELLRLFEANYRQPNAAFLDRSLATLRHVALAYSNEVAVGFALAETRVIDLPRLPGQVVGLAGLSCIAPEFRRRGLFNQLARLAFGLTEVPATRRLLLCGRTAHPAAFRTIGRFPGAVPEAGRRPTPWQQEVGEAIARAYGVHEFDPETFVCVGDGHPIGYPRIEFDVEPDEWKVFEPVDRDRGDSLLALGWVPNGPASW
jgi:hypothetical protein